MSTSFVCTECGHSFRSKSNFCPNCAARLNWDAAGSLGAIVKCAHCNGDGSVYKNLGDCREGGSPCPACGGSGKQWIKPR